ncbi:hypothetical protein [Bacillus sp. FSL K6-3431]
MTYDDKLTEYFELITRKFHSGKINEDKYGRLAEKIEEWSDVADETEVTD